MRVINRLHVTDGLRCIALETVETAWNLMTLHETTGHCMKLHNTAWNYMTLYVTIDIAWNYMTLHKKCLKLHVVTWHFMKNHDSTGNFRKLHKSSRNFIKLHETAFTRMILPWHYLKLLQTAWQQGEKGLIVG